jgi:hypothetical protein
MLGSYLHLMHEVDDSLASVIADLSRQGALDNTLLVVFGDHDARMQVPDGLIASAAQELGASEETIRQLGARDARVDFVPLFVRLPRHELTGVVATAGGQIDIGPTIAFLLGLHQPAVFLGRPLLPGAAGFAARIDGSALSNDRLFVANGVGVPADGACVSFPARTALALGECESLKEAAFDQIEVSWLFTEKNLAPFFVKTADRVGADTDDPPWTP